MFKDSLARYIRDESAVGTSIEEMLFVVLGVVGATIVAYMIYNRIKIVKEAMGSDFGFGG